MVQWKVQSMSHIDADISRSINCIYNNVWQNFLSNVNQAVSNMVL